MIKEDIQKEQEMLSTLLPSQKEVIESLDWYYYGGRGRGASYVLCILTLRRVLHNNYGFISDHHPFQQSNEHTLSMLRGLAEKWKIKIKITRYGHGYLVERIPEPYIYYEKENKRTLPEW